LSLKVDTHIYLGSGSKRSNSDPTLAWFILTPGIYTMYAAFGLGTPISYAAREGHLDVVKRLVEKGADPHIVDSRGQLPVDAAKSRGHMDVVTYLQSLPDPKDPKLVHFVDSHQWKDF
jgi:hypothetical protein